MTVDVSPLQMPAIDERAMPSNGWSVDDCPSPTLLSRFRGEQARIVIIEGRTLFGECLLACLKAADPANRFSLYPTVDKWLDDRDGERSAVLLICVNDDPNEAAATLKRVNGLDPSTRFIVVSSQENHSEVYKALELGAGGYILTSMNLRVLIQVIHLVHAGGTFVPASVVKNQPTLPAPQGSGPQSELSDLSPRQLLVAKALRRGTPNKIIAYELNMCESTVKVHVRHIMKKLNAKNRTQVAFLTNSLFSKDDH